MKPSRITLSQLVTWTQTATQTDVSARELLRSHLGMFTVIQGKSGLKVAREWLLGVALLDLHSQATGLPKKPDS